jgi:Tfp pilus assembly protein PilV
MKLSRRLFDKKIGSIIGGQTLFEVIFVIGVISVILVGILSLSTSSVRDSNYSNSKSIATKYAQEGAEWIRSQRDANWDSFLTHTNATCLGSLSWSSSCTITGTLFSRSIAFVCYRYTSGPPVSTVSVSCGSTGVNMVDATVIVSWNDAQGTHQSKSITTLTRWH